MTHYKHLDTITALFVAVLLISNVTSTKIVDFDFLVFDAGTLLFPLSYIFGDILTEVYGYKRARKVIWLGFISALLMSVIFMLVSLLPPDAEWGLQESYDAILGVTPRIVVASLIAYLAGEFSNAKIFATLKTKTNGRMLWLRAIGSTIIGQGLDTVIFVFIAFAGIFSGSLLWSIMWSNYLFKLIAEVILLPCTYRIVHFLQKTENSTL